MAIYLRRKDIDRQWTVPSLLHESLFLEDDRQADDEYIRLVLEADFVIFSNYSKWIVRRSMTLRNASGKPWCFWGERPGYLRLGLLGYLYRRIFLNTLHMSNAPIWGIGHWAVEGYKNEFGESRFYCNVPYFSDLKPFLGIEKTLRSDNACRFLFSGQFIRRKGLELLLSAFLHLLKEEKNIELHLVGSGGLEKKIKKQMAGYPAVHFHGFRQGNELAAVYALADVLCAPSLYDGWGLIIPEGLAAGLPVISTKRTGAARELLNEENGWLIPAADESALYAAMKAAVKAGPERRREMGMKARNMAKSQDVEIGVSRFIQAIELSIAEI